LQGLMIVFADILDGVEITRRNLVEGQ